MESVAFALERWLMRKRRTVGASSVKAGKLTRALFPEPVREWLEWIADWHVLTP